MRLLIMGPPGAGKGTQATAVALHYRVPAISSGAIFRDNIDRRTPLGLKVEALIAVGDFVPDVITSSLVFARLLEPDCATGWLLDGYPRTLGQVEALDLAMSERGEVLDAAISLLADPDELVGRMLRRAEIEGRLDDNEQTIRHRIGVYHEETVELLDLYRERELLVEVDALGEVGDVTRRLIQALDARLGSRR